MNRDQAIRELRELRDWLVALNPASVPESVRAVDYALAVLEAEEAAFQRQVENAKRGGHVGGSSDF